METPDSFPTHQDVTDDLKQLVRGLEHWKRLSLPSLRALPSVRFGRTPKSVRDRHADKPNRLTCLVIAKRINEAIDRMGSEREQRALHSLIDFTEPPPGLTERRTKAAEHYGVKLESFRTGTEKNLLLVLTDQIFRGEQAWTVNNLDPKLKQ